jgi:molybdopterin synthase catalytic subunit
MLEGQADVDDWVALTRERLPVHAALDWAVRPDCGAVVLFSGTVRDHSEGRPGVTSLEYEAYEEEVEPRLAAIIAEARHRWPAVGRIALLHRSGPLAVSETSVVVAVSAPHRDEAFAAARWAIDTLKATVPIWKRESWAQGEDWSACDHPVADVAPGRPAWPEGSGRPAWPERGDRPAWPERSGRQ